MGEVVTTRKPTLLATRTLLCDRVGMTTLEGPIDCDDVYSFIVRIRDVAYIGSLTAVIKAIGGVSDEVGRMGDVLSPASDGSTFNMSTKRWLDFVVTTAQTGARLQIEVYARAA